MDAAHARRADMSAGARFGELLRHVDPASQWAIKRFLIKLAVVVAFAGAIMRRPAAESLLVLAYVNVLASMTLAVLQRERCGGGVLNHWDEAAAFTALCALAHVAKAAIG